MTPGLSKVIQMPLITIGDIEGVIRDKGSQVQIYFDWNLGIEYLDSVYGV